VRPEENARVELDVLVREQVHVEQVGHGLLEVADRVAELHDAHALRALDELHHLVELLGRLGLLERPRLDLLELVAHSARFRTKINAPL
jgi:hypothetical protein